jgi:hypothetical protein
MPLLSLYALLYLLTCAINLIVQYIITQTIKFGELCFKMGDDHCNPKNRSKKPVISLR